MISYQGNANTLGLRFSGSVTASISHEIKNALAIINENAGLLNDLAMLAENGRPLNPERLKTQAGNIMRQVQRADGIVRRLNRFAHSASEPVTNTDLEEIFNFTAELAERLATMKGVTITVAQVNKVKLQVRPFVLENLLWICLQSLFSLATGSQAVELGAEEVGENHVVIVLQFSDGVSVAEIGAQVAKQGQPLITLLQTDMSISTEHNTIRLKMPAKFNE